MKINMPVTDVEYPIKENISIVSKTDLKGVITYANEDFIRISGFSREELIGKAHNIVRHPDVPAEFFEDMWKSLKAGRPWTGVVKNRCKNGDYYWLLNNVAPFYENDQLVGYMSVRLKASPEQIDAANEVYRLFRDGKAGSLKIQDGKVVNSTLWGKLNPFKNFTVKSRLTFLIGLLSLLMMVIGGMGLRGMNKTNEGLRSVYKDRTVTMGLMFTISELQRENLMLIAGSLVNPNPETIQQNATELDQNILAITKPWNAYLATHLTPEEKILADNFTENSTRFVRKGLKPAMEALRANDIALADKIRKKDISPLYKRANESIRELMQLQMDVAKEVYAAAQSRYNNTRNIAIGLILMGIALALSLGFTLIRAIVRPLETAISHFGKIAQGHYNNTIDIESHDELGKVMAALKAMQIKCGFDVAETKRIADEHRRIKVALDNVSTGVMIADNVRNIIYANKSVLEILGKAEDDIRKQLPDFSVASLVGTNIDSFHKNPSYQAQILSSLHSAHSACIEVGGRPISLIVSPVINDEGQRLGTVAECKDYTIEKLAENEVDAILQAAIRGDFTRRIEIEHKEGFFIQLGEGLNELLETVESGINDVRRVLNALAHRNLTLTITHDCSGSFELVKNDANITVEKLKESINQIKAAIDSISSGDKEIASGNRDLTNQTGEQAIQIAVDASTMADKGIEAINQVVLNMDEIDDYAHKIAGIIRVIDDIVLQTKMLAHTAAIEAARAGEQGEGFAAVSTEMRNLGQRVAAAAEEIKNLVDVSLNKVCDGKKLVTQAALTVEEIVNSMHDITMMLSETSNFSEAQRACIKQINKAIGTWTM
ncbi:MAG: MCP four helix bundle domain-containing protein [Methylococcales bacterium]|nr:MCP four helix bundle domain-containing protein [Methylococcales bacterium]